MRRNAFLALRLCLLALAAWALHRELALVNAHELVAALRSYGWRNISVAVVCTAGSFATLAVFEILALRYVSIARDVPARTALATSFVAHAFGQSIGFSLLTGAAIRARAYERYSVRTRDIARMSAFVTVTVTLGLLASGAVAFLASSQPVSLGRFDVSPRPVGALLAALVLAYLGWSATVPDQSTGQEHWGIARPTLSLATQQVTLSVVDWLLTGTVLFAFLPAGINLGYFAFVRAYLMAQTAGMVSHVPGGLGVFEAVLVAILFGATPGAGTAAIVASLVMYRVVYYLIPLGIALLFAAMAEFRRTHRGASFGPSLGTQVNPAADGVGSNAT